MHLDWLRERLTVEEAESKHLVMDERLGPSPIPFGFCNEAWKDLLCKKQPGDEIWEFSSTKSSWQQLCGRRGIALVRNSTVVTFFLTVMN